jgi:hypothetical protein
MNVWASRNMTAGGLNTVTSTLTNTLIGGVLTVPSGASF